jgi:Na+-driven multidrug efflux pump
MWFLGVVGLMFVVFAPRIVALFTSDPQVAAYAIDCLRIVAAGFLFYAYGMVISASFNGAGDTLTPTLLNLFCFWMFEIPLAYLLARHAGMGPRGVFIAMMLAFSMLAFTSALMFRRGTWKTRKV